MGTTAELKKKIWQLFSHFISCGVNDIHNTCNYTKLMKHDSVNITIYNVKPLTAYKKDRVASTPFTHNIPLKSNRTK